MCLNPTESLGLVVKVTLVVCVGLQYVCAFVCVNVRARFLTERHAYVGRCVSVYCIKIQINAHSEATPARCAG